MSQISFQAALTCTHGLYPSAICNYAKSTAWMLLGTSAGAGNGAKSAEAANWKLHAKMLLGMDAYPNGYISQEAERRKKQGQERTVG